MKNIVLIGFMGSGKTEVGKRLAERFGYRFVDTDRIIEEKTGKSIADIFRENGEAYFRGLEAGVVRELSGAQRHVISTGGGIVINRENILSLRKGGWLVYLKASPETIYKRINGEFHRPLLNVGDPLDEIKRLMDIRGPLYSEADLSIETDEMEAEEIAEIIVNAYLKVAGRR